MRSAFVILVGICAAVSVLGASPIRIYSLVEACFPYRFDGISVAGEKGDLLAFSDLSGRRSFVTVGEELPGAYRVDSLEKRVVRKFDPSLNSEREMPAHRVTLHGPESEITVLDVGVHMKVPGMMACMVNTASGEYCYVAKGQSLLYEDALWQVDLVTNSMVTVSLGSERQEIPMVTEAERESVKNLWAERTRLNREKSALAESKRREKRVAEETEHNERIARFRASPPSVKSSSSKPTTMHFGTEYRYPVEWDVVPIWGRSNGQPVLQAVAVPRRFETRQGGFLIREQD